MFPTVNNALVLANTPALDVPHFLVPVLSAAATSARERLIIVLFSRFFDCPNPAHHWDDIHSLLTFVYVQAAKVAQDLDKVLLDVDVLLFSSNQELPSDIGQDMNIVFRVEGDCIAAPLPLSVLSLDQNYIPPANGTLEDVNPVHSSSDLPPIYAVVALGGTFDHLHAGHKILLSMGAWIAKERIIVGVTDDVLLRKKAYKEVLEPIEMRIQRVRRFLQLFKPSLIHDVVPIDDVYGPTGWDPNVQALVVSKETISGARSIDEHRARRSLPTLQTFVIDIISSTSSNLNQEDADLLKQVKMSSTFIREWIVKHQNQ